MEKATTILPIDDDPLNMLALSAFFKSGGYTILTAASALEGIAIMRNETGIAGVLLDIMMPGMDGCEALRSIKNYSSLAVGANEYIARPVDVDVMFNLREVYNQV